jgi:glycosyltransferase involved in cell wall biosynthesis
MKREQWPRITVVTPSYNQAAYLEETIRSVLLQGYPNLQYIVIDGGSSDGSQEIIAKYEPFLDYWVSEKDQGQSEAINKGLEIADGEIVGWLNSDDLYLPDALHTVGQAFRENSDVEWVAGSVLHREEGIPDVAIASEVSAPLSQWMDTSRIQQPASFWKRSLHQRLGQLDESLHYVMDTELFLRFLLAGKRPVGISSELAIVRMHTASKTVSGPNAFRMELTRTVFPKYYPSLPFRERLRSRHGIAIKHLRMARHSARDHQYKDLLRNVMLSMKWQPFASGLALVGGLGRLFRSSSPEKTS